MAIDPHASACAGLSPAGRSEMVRLSRAQLKDVGISRTLLETLVCPLSKQLLRLSKDSSSLICGSLGVVYPVVNEIPCLVPKDGKLLETQDSPNSDNPSKHATVERNQS